MHLSLPVIIAKFLFHKLPRLAVDILGDCTMPQKVRRRLVRASNLSLPVTLLLLCIWYGPYGDEAQRTTLSYILHFYFSITV